MQNILSQLMQKHHIPVFGCIPYASVSDHLIPCRAIKRIPQHAKTVIMMLFPYYVAPFEQRNISLYAVIPDYHAIVGEILSGLAADCKEIFGCEFEPFTDSTPIPEVVAAAKAGLGVIGQNGLLLHEQYGSYCFIGELITDMDFHAICQPTKSCIGCGACKRNCPQAAIGENTRDYTVCLSAITQKKKNLTDAEQQAIAKSGFVWGCDRCQDVCPYNRHPKQTEIPAFLHGAVPVITEENVDKLFADRAFAWRGEAVIKRNLSLIK